ncbi:hybrid sensor histidine kinase/response regulator [Candidatus Sulfurimonas baltica]|uniref:histidine kinase n=1 Tax=Candidatus Sulfurimonas baltica TaxID=2740404 RepID=A0A7S7LYU7_9BACT|nr:response regulator [Candidatus Sulfurimonas baltica]QOY53358.1 response regulator [Candidatus Sulfurimonas baltica]
MNNHNNIAELKKITKNLTLLYVEDDEQIRKSTAEIFSHLVQTVHVAADGQEGLDLYGEYFLDNGRYYDIVISDIQMPRMDGLTMSKMILQTNKKQKIILISAHDEHMLEAINIGIEGFIQKPLKSQQVFDVLKKVSLTFHSDDLQYFNALTEASIISKSDMNGIITYVNDNFCKITGYTREEMIGHSHSMFRHPNNPNEIYIDMWKTITSGIIWRERMVNLNKDGSEFIAESTIIPLLDENDNIKEYMAIRNDVTDAVTFKRKIFLEEQEKIKRIKIAEAQKSFLVVFTHELKTPLNAIINFTKYVKKQIELPKELNKEKLSSLLESVLSNAHDMLENVTQILEVSKLNAHKLTYNYSVFNAKDIVSEVMKRYNSLLTEKNITLTCDVQDDALISNDVFRVKQIFSNIVSNAIKYGNNEIKISVLNKEHITVSVEDNGPGIKDKDAVFNLYSQEDDGLLERKSQGTGVGLYFVKLLCTDLHISYKVEDRNEGSGTKFTLTFNEKQEKGA